VALPGAVVEAEVDGGRCGWVGDVPADGLVYIGELELPADANRVTLTLRHPSLADVANSYDDVLEWLRIVSG
jgi:hypothetical protein